MKKSADCELFDGLIREADVYIQNFRPGTAQRLGAGVEQLQQINPRLVYCSISGFGASGPYAERPSYDSVAQALSGFLVWWSTIGDPSSSVPHLPMPLPGCMPRRAFSPPWCSGAAPSAARHVEVSMLEAMAHFAVEPFAAFFALGETPTSADRPRLAQAYILRTADERLIAIHLSSLEKFWQGLVSALDAPELATDPRFNPRERRIAEYEVLRLELDARFVRQPLAHWIGRLQANDVPYAPVNRLDDVVADPQVRHLGIVVPIEGAHTAREAVRPALQFNGSRAQSVSAAPLLDQHGKEIRASLAAGSAWPGDAACTGLTRREGQR